jgi:hypothetical protein
VEASLALFSPDPMSILAIDPGPERSAWVIYEPERKRLNGIGTFDNGELARAIREKGPLGWPDLLAVEMIASYGMPVGREVFETCVWIGRFIEAWPVAHRKVYRKEVAMHLCGSPRAKDPNVRAALIDLFGGSKAAAVGTKRAQGPLYGVSKDVWSALAVAVTAAETSAA